MNFKKTAKISSVMLASVLCLSVSAIKANAVNDFNDTKNHWARVYISQAVSKGYVSGYSDGTFKPNNPVTRAEFVKMLNNALGIRASADIAFSDVSASRWYYDEVKKAVAAGYISGYSDNTFAADNYVTRQEAAVIISRIVTDSDKNRSITDLSDYRNIPSWAENAVEKVFSKGYMTGDGNRRFNPSARLTRAESVKIINMILQNEQIVSSDVTISQSNFTYDNRICTGNITVSESTPSGNIYIDGCTILGALNISCRNGNKVVLNNSNAGTVNLTSGTQSVTLSLTGKSSVSKVNVMRPATLRTEQSVSGAGFSEITLSGSNIASATVSISADAANVNVMNSAKLELLGNVSNLNVKKSGVDLSISGGNVENLTVDPAASSAKITLSAGTTVKYADIKAKTAFRGSGKIQKAVENAAGITYDTQPTNLQKYGSSSSATLAASFSPSSGKTGVAVYENIEISFAQAVYKTGGTALTAGYIENGAVELRRGSVNGSSVDFSAEISSTKRKIIITPDEYLAADTGYYIILNEGRFAAANGTKNSEQTAYFKTAENSELAPVVTPSGGKNGVPVDTNITLKFDSKIYRKSGSEINAGYIENSVIELRKNSASGSLVEFSAEINGSKNTITVTPTKDLQSKTTYYVIVKSSSISDEDGNYNGKTVSKFTTTASISTSPSKDEEDVTVGSSISITFGNPVCKPDGGSIRGSYLEEKIRISGGYLSKEFSASISSSGKVITLRPKSDLSANTTYTVSIPAGTLAYEDEDYGEIGAFSFKFKTESGKSNVSYFDIESTGLDYVTATVRADSDGTAYFTLKNASGSTVSTQNVNISKNSDKEVTFEDLTENTKYSLSVYVKNSFGNTSQTLTETFTTKTPSLDITAGNIDFTSAKIKIDYNTAGILNVSYGEKGSSVLKEILTNVEATRGGSNTATLSELTSGKTYTVNAEFKIGDRIITKSYEFTTDSVMTDASLSQVKVSADGVNYIAELNGNNVYEAAITANIGDSIRVIPTATGGSRAKIKVNGSEVKSGSGSEKITVEQYGEITVDIEVTAEDNSQRQYTVKITVSEK